MTKAKAKITKDKSAKSEARANSTSNASALPVCLFFSMLTAIIIALVLAITFASLADRYELIDATKYRGSLAESIQDNHKDSSGIVMISGAAIVDWIHNTEASGFVYVSSKDCGSFCTNYEKNLADYIKSEDCINVFHFDATSVNDKDYPTAVATKLTLGSDNAPMLIYIKDGVIYDRVDNIESSSMESFINKYK